MGLNRPPAAAVRKRAQSATQRKKERGGEFVHLPKKDGESLRFRVLGPWDDAAMKRGVYFGVRRKHFSFPKVGDRTVIRCLRVADGTGDCPACDAVEEFAEHLGDNAWKYRSSPEYLLSVVVRGKKDEPESVSTLDATGRQGEDLIDFLDGQIQEALDQDDVYILDPKAGFDVSATRDKKRTTFTLVPGKGPSPAMRSGKLPEKFKNLGAMEAITDEERKLTKKAARRFRAKLEAQLASETKYQETEEDDEEEVSLTDADGNPRGWRTKSSGAPRAPKTGSDGRPVCMGDWLSSARGNSSKRDRPKNGQCRICPHEGECREESAE